jgi:hypothetical protein
LPADLVINNQQLRGHTLKGTKARSYRKMKSFKSLSERNDSSVQQPRCRHCDTVHSSKAGLPEAGNAIQRNRSSPFE